MGGYDVRTQTSDRRVISYTHGISGVVTSYPVAASVSSVISYRDNPTGQIVHPKDVDPYAWFISSEMDRRRTSAKKDNALGSNVNAIIDNGHPYVVERHRTLSKSVKGTWYPNTSNTSDYRYGSPICTGFAEVSSLFKTGMLFQYQGVSFGKTSPKANLASWSHNYYGSRAIADYAPTKPSINISVTIAELIREGLPDFLALSATWKALVKVNQRLLSRPAGPKVLFRDLLNDFSSFPKNASQDFLNYMFAIRPLVQDMEKTFAIFENIDNILKQYQADAGNGVRRRVLMRDEDHKVIFGSDKLSNQGMTGVGRSYWPASFSTSSSTADSAVVSRKTVVTQRFQEKIYFSGSFSYYLPVPDSFWGSSSLLYKKWERLMGSPVSWEALWELTPWSWFIDWFIDLQGALRAAKIGQDKNLVVNYGYLTRIAKAFTNQSTVLEWPVAKKRATPFVSTSYVSSRIERVRANPFGFEIKQPESLSGIQWLLLAAVGISRG